jgi:hypothetical protein
VNAFKSQGTAVDLVFQQFLGNQAHLVDAKKLVRAEYLNQPLFMMPGYW